MKRLLIIMAMAVAITFPSFAQSGSNRVMVGVGALFVRGFDATISIEHEISNHNAWEFFVNGYLQYSVDKEAGHVTTKSFWNDNHTWGAGAAYKLCVYKGKNHYGSLRLGASCGSDTKKFVGCALVGYEQNFVLRRGWQVYLQVKADVCINARDLFRSGLVVGVKIPTERH